MTCNCRELRCAATYIHRGEFCSVRVTRRGNVCIDCTARNAQRAPMPRCCVACGASGGASHCSNACPMQTYRSPWSLGVLRAVRPPARRARKVSPFKGKGEYVRVCQGSADANLLQELQATAISQNDALALLSLVLEGISYHVEFRAGSRGRTRIFPDGSVRIELPETPRSTEPLGFLRAGLVLHEATHVRVHSKDHGSPFIRMLDHLTAKTVGLWRTP